MDNDDDDDSRGGGGGGDDDGDEVDDEDGDDDDDDDEDYGDGGDCNNDDDHDHDDLTDAIKSADKVISGQISIGTQHHFHMETQVRLLLVEKCAYAKTPNVFGGKACAQTRSFWREPARASPYKTKRPYCAGECGSSTLLFCCCFADFALCS